MRKQRSLTGTSGGRLRTGHLRPAMVTKNVIVAGGALRRPAQVEGQVVRAGDQAADQQEVPRAGGGDQRPVREPGALGRRSRTSGARRPRPSAASSALITVPDGQGDPEVARDDRHVRQARWPRRPRAARCCGRTPRRRPPTGRAGPHSSSRSSWPMASCGLVLRSSSPGMPAARRRRQVLLPALRHEHVEIRPGLPGRGHPRGEHRGDAVLHVPVHPACCGATHAVASPSLSCAVSSIAIPGPIRSPGSHGSQARARRGQLRPQVLPVPPVAAQQGLHPVRVLVPGRLGQVPAVRLHPRRQPPHVVQRRPGAAALRQHPAQHRPDLRIHPARGIRTLTYAGLSRPCRHCRWSHIRQRGTAAPNFTRCNSGTPLIVITQRDPSSGHPAPRSIRIVAFCETATDQNNHLGPLT